MQKMAIIFFTWLSIEAISYDGAAAALEMNTDLVRTSCVGPGQNQSLGAIGGEGFDGGEGSAAPLNASHLLAVNGVAADGVFDGTAAGVAAGDGKVGFFDLAGGKLLDEARVGGSGFGSDKDAGGVFIEAVDDARA